MITPDGTTIQVCSSGYGRAVKALTLDATRRFQFVVHAASWLHSMVLRGWQPQGHIQHDNTDTITANTPW